MQTTDTSQTHDLKSQSPYTRVKQKDGFYNSAMLTRKPEEVYAFCKDISNVEKVLADLPLDLENFLDLELVNAESQGSDRYLITWKNKAAAKVSGTLLFEISAASQGRGSVMSAAAKFDGLHANDEEPSSLMNLFLKRMKALAETGVIATTKGQPSGREEISQTEDKKLH